MAAPELAGKRILVVEDEFLIANDIREGLVELGATVIGPASTLEKGLELAGAGDLDGALLDLNLGDRLSLPIADILRRRNIRFVFATGYDTSSVPPQYRDVALFTKPFDMTLVAAALI